MAFSKMQQYVSANIDFSHTNAIIISKDIAKDGIQRYIANISSNFLYNNNMYLLICEDSPKEFIEEIDNNKNVDPIDFFDVLENSQEVSGCVDITNISNFENNLFTTFTVPTAPICKINREKQEANKQNKSNTQNSENKTQSENGTKNSNKNNSEIVTEIGGTAVFKDDSLIGTLSNEETALHTMLTSKLNSYKFSLSEEENNSNNKENHNECTENQSKNINIDITQTKLAKIKVDTKSSNPKIDITIPVDITVLDSPSNEYNYLDNEYLKEVKENVSQSLDKKMDDYLNKVKNELSVDLDGFYKYSRLNFLTSKEYEDYNFEDKFKDARFNVKFDVSFTDPGLNLEK